MRFLREEMAETRHGALTLNDKQRPEVVLGERLEHGHGPRLSSAAHNGGHA